MSVSILENILRNDVQSQISQYEIQYYEIDQKTHSIIEQFSFCPLLCEPVLNHNLVYVFCLSLQNLF